MSIIEHVALYADDLEALRSFYERVFELRVIVDNSHAPTPGYFLAGSAGSALEIIRRPAGSGADQRFICHVAFYVDNYEAKRSELESAGMAFEVGTAVDDGSMTTSFFADPAGNRVQIVRRSRPLGDAGGLP